MEEVKKCPFCGEEVKAEAIKCKHCHEIIGERKPVVEEYKRCPHCGGAISPDAKKCKHCYQWLPIDTQPLVVEPQKESSEENKPSDSVEPYKDTTRYKHSGICTVANILMFLFAVDWCKHLLDYMGLESIRTGRGLVSLCVFVAQNTPEWVVSTLITLLYIYIYYSLRDHFAANRKSLSAYIIIYVGCLIAAIASTFGGEIVTSLSIIILVFAMISMFILDIVIGRGISRNYIGAGSLGITMIITTILVFIGDLPDMLEERDIIFYSISTVSSIAFLVVLNNYFSNATIYAIGKSAEIKEKVEVEASKTSNKAFSGWLIAITVALALLFGIASIGDTPTSESKELDVSELYIVSDLEPNYYTYVGYASDCADDMFAESYNSKGNIYMIACDNLDDDDISIVLSCAELSDSDAYSTGEFGPIYPYSTDPDIVYFDYYPGGDYNQYGKVDITTGEYQLFDGAFVGYINKGEYKGCYLTVDWTSLDICPQTAINKKSDPVWTVSLEDLEVEEFYEVLELREYYISEIESF